MWIKLHRSLLDWEYFRRSEVLHIFIFLLLKATHGESYYQGIQLQRGQLIITRKELSLMCGLSEQQVRTGLKLLSSANQIRLDTTTRYTVVTIINFDKHQTNQQINQRINQQPTNEEYSITPCIKTDCDSQKHQTNQQSTNEPTNEPTNLYIQEYKNNIYHSHLTRACEVNDILSIDECHDRLMDDAAWKEDALMSIRLNGYKQITEIDSWLERFFAKLKADGDTFRNLRDCKKHFVSWINIILKNEKNKRTSRKQEANEYALNQFTNRYTRMDGEVPDIL